MNDILNNKPAIFIDQKKARIRISRHTLHMLGEPQFIQFLVNPESLTVVIRPSKQGDALAHRIGKNRLTAKKSYELYSSFFIRKLHNICENWRSGESYRLFGEVITSENIVLFDLKRAMPVSFTLEANNE